MSELPKWLGRVEHVCVTKSITLREAAMYGADASFISHMRSAAAHQATDFILDKASYHRTEDDELRDVRQYIWTFDVVLPPEDGGSYFAGQLAAAKAEARKEALLEAAQMVRSAAGRAPGIVYSGPRTLMDDLAASIVERATP